MTPTELKQRIAECLNNPPANAVPANHFINLLRACLSHIEEQEIALRESRVQTGFADYIAHLRGEKRDELEILVKQLQSKLTALEKERDELRFKLKTYAMFRLRCDACGDLFNDHHQGEGCPGAFYKNCGGTLQFNLPEVVREEMRQLRAACAAKDEALYTAATDIRQWMQLAINHRRSLGDKANFEPYCPSALGIEHSERRLVVIAKALSPTTGSDYVKRSETATVTTEDTCSNCGAKLTNAETARLNWQAEAARLDVEMGSVKDLLHWMLTDPNGGWIEPARKQLTRLESLLNPPKPI